MKLKRFVGAVGFVIMVCGTGSDGWLFPYFNFAAVIIGYIMLQSSIGKQNEGYQK